MSMGKAFVIVEDGKLTRYRRRGSCNMCGECCCRHAISGKFTSSLAHEGDKIKNAEKSDDSDDWSEWEGWSAHRQHGLWWWWKMSEDGLRDEPCGAFADGKCAWWGDSDEFPAICRDWPVHPDNLEHFPDCGFSFEKVEQ